MTNASKIHGVVPTNQYSEDAGQDLRAAPDVVQSHSDEDHQDPRRYLQTDVA